MRCSAAHWRSSVLRILPDGVRARHGFRGCVASVTVNGQLVRPIADAAISVARATVEDGCRAEKSYCTASSCAHGGVCVQEWTGFSCDCDLTSHAGPTCSEGDSYNAVSA